MPAEADVFSRPAQTALKRISEKALKDLAKKQTVESRAALIGPIYPYGSAAILVFEIEIVTTDPFFSRKFLNAFEIRIKE